MQFQVSCAALRCSGADHGTARDDTDKPILSSSTGSQMLQNGPELNRHGKRKLVESTLGRTGLIVTHRDSTSLSLRACQLVGGLSSAWQVWVASFVYQSIWGRVEFAWMCWHGVSACLLAGEEVAPQLLQPLADPLELGDADSCNDPQKMHCKDQPKDTQAPWFSILNWMAGWEFGGMGGCCMWPGCVNTVDGFNPCSRTRRNELPLEQRSAVRMLGIIYPKRGIQGSNDLSSKIPSEKQPSDPPRVKRSQASMRNQIQHDVWISTFSIMRCQSGRPAKDHGLRFAVRDGCLKCVKHYVGLGADTWSYWVVRLASSCFCSLNYSIILQLPVDAND